MSKKRRPRKLRRRAQKLKTKPQHESSTDLHHLCWPRKKWKNGFASEIRNHWYFKISIPKNTLHCGIHAIMQGIPVPDGTIAKQAYLHVMVLEHNGFLSSSDPFETRLRLLIALFHGTKTGSAFKKQLEIVQNFKPPK